MTIRVALNHHTRYHYDRPIALSPHVVRLRPAPHCRTPILAYSLRITPHKHFINWQQDPFGNYLARLVIPEKTRHFEIEVDLVAALSVINPFDFFLEEEAMHFPFTYEEPLAHDLAPYLKIRAQGSLLGDWLGGVDRSKQPTIDFLVALNQRLQQDIAYNVRMEPGVQDCDETLAKASGSCRDSAWLLAQILRHLGLASRFVSGYLVQLKADQASLDGPSGPDADFTDLHAWTEVYLPGAGWVGMDPTSGLFASEGHIPLACTPDPGSAAAITGHADEAQVDFYFHNQVERIHEDPRVTKPYTEQQWQTINALGHKIDADLQRLDVRLTMGGEPTFVSIDDRDSAQWNSAALGEHKRQLAGELLLRLQQQFAPGSVLQFGQGKWYPGEPLPRWAMACFWRADGVSLWQDQALLAHEAQAYDYNYEHARQFGEQLATHLGIARDYLITAYEDPLYHLWMEGQMPVNLDPETADLSDSRARRHLARVLEAGLQRPAGYVLPLRCTTQQGWHSSIWPLRRDRLYLTPGDSALGLRLPLDTLPWVKPEQRDLHRPLDPFTEHQTLPTIPQSFNFNRGPRSESDRVEPTPSQDIIHTALCLQVRNGGLYVFLPPLTELEHYLDLLAKIESVAQALLLPIFLEGYEPPSDPRLKQFKITPDPGVIEVNIHPARNWDELVHTTTTLYEEARLARLGTEKFMLDGRHTGTGGGNHLTLGGPTAADSPILRRPDLLRSLLTFWQHHPSLSYLFSGLFIGPTSQAPRVDEARHEALYELEIALHRIPSGEITQPWLVDRLLRHLLIDLTGNTHRAEFCIDKLYSPDSASGRLGLLEMRAFEMPPHAHMSLVQMLLVRALIAHFWKQPYHHDLVRWGTQLHDRFMLPHYVHADIKDVIHKLQSADYPFQRVWLDPFFEFRFPHYGQVQIGDISLELRMALEPWHVLGEEVTGSGTARFVDSSIERLQVKVTGMTDNRHIILCNKRRVELHSTGVQGEFIAGVRYRAWQPPSALHPTIAVHVPLVFDIVDTWNGRAIGGCTYHVSHPGGYNSEDIPVNAFAAETRRIARFDDFGHTPGPIQPPPEYKTLASFYPEGHPSGPIEPLPEEPNAEYPYTLDLRR